MAALPPIEVPIIPKLEVPELPEVEISSEFIEVGADRFGRVVDVVQTVAQVVIAIALILAG